MWLDVRLFADAAVSYMQIKLEANFSAGAIKTNTIDNEYGQKRFLVYSCLAHQSKRAKNMSILKN